MTNPIPRPPDLERDELDVFDEVQRRVARAAGQVGPCPDPGRLVSAQAGTLPAPDAEPVLFHLSACLACQTLVEALVDPLLLEPTDHERRRIDARVANATAAAASGRVLWFRTPARWAGTAALTAAAAAVLILVAPGMSIDPSDCPVVAARERPGGTQTAPRSILRAERLVTSEMGLASLPWRGDAAGNGPASPFDGARAAFDRGDFNEAERSLRAIVERTPAFADAWLLLGVSRLLLGEPGDAAAPLQRASATLVGPARDDARWHLAVAFHEAGRDAEARDVLESLCLERTGRGAMACVALGELRVP